VRRKTVVLENNSAGAVGKRRQPAEHLEVLGPLDDFLAGEEFEQGGFAAARRSDERDEFAAADDQVNIVEHGSHAAQGGIEIAVIGVLQMDGSFPVMGGLGLGINSMMFLL
jgi:hypothetical protein